MRSSLAGTKMSAAWWRWVLPEMPSGPCRRPCQPTRRRWSWVLHGPVTVFFPSWDRAETQSLVARCARRCGYFETLFMYQSLRVVIKDAVHC